MTKALVHRVCKARRVGSVIKITAYELDRTIIPALRREYEHLQRQCDDTGISFHATILNADFIECTIECCASRLIFLEWIRLQHRDPQSSVPENQ